MAAFGRVARVLLLLALPWTPAAACGPDSPCRVDGGDYMIRLPAHAGPPEKVGAIVYFHGYRDSAAGVMRNKALADVAAGLDVALLAPDGAGGTWSFPGAPRRLRDEFAFVDRVMADALARFPIDPARVMAAGFSMGGSMVWNLACRMPDRFAGFVPVAGAFWEPLPDGCANAGQDRLPDLFHVHGRADAVVPMAGRPIGDVARQGDVYASFQALMAGLSSPPAPTTFREDDFDCRGWRDGGAGDVELCLHDGGHSIRAEWIARGWRKLAAARNWR